MQNLGTCIIKGIHKKAKKRLGLTQGTNIADALDYLQCIHRLAATVYSFGLGTLKMLPSKRANRSRIILCSKNGLNILSFVEGSFEDGALTYSRDH